MAKSSIVSAPYISTLTPWSSGITIPLNRPVVYLNSLYRCDETHTTGVTFDQSKFTALTGLPEAPNDGSQYARKNAAWTEIVVDVTEAPNDGKAYARKNAAWSEVVNNKITMNADGSVSIGDAVFVLENGKVTKTLPQTGTPAVFESASTEYTSVTMLDSSKAIVTYRDNGNSSYGTACVLSISGTVITAGAPVVFESASTSDISVTMLDSSKAIVTYRDNGNSNYGTACVLSISGSTITAGAPVVFESAITYYTSVTMLDSSKAIVTYTDNGNSNYGTACVLSVSGTVITAGAPVVFESAATNYISVTMLDSSKAIVTYQDNGNSSYGTACVLSISGTVITAGAPVVFESAATYYTSVAMLDSTKAIVTYMDNGNSNYGTACVLSISGSTITAGAPVVFERAITNYISVTMLDSSKAIVTYTDSGNSSYGTACILSISGTTITAGAPVVFESAITYYTSVTMLDSTKAIVTYQDNGNSNYGTACVLGAQSVDGIATSTATNAPVDVVFPGVVDGLSGLSTGKMYYVGPDGNKTINPTGFRLGKAISSTQLLLKIQ
jgi:hypothetical protein